MNEKSSTMKHNVGRISEAYGIPLDDPISIYLKDFMEFEMRNNLVPFNEDNNAQVLRNWPS